MSRIGTQVHCAIPLSIWSFDSNMNCKRSCTEPIHLFIRSKSVTMDKLLMAFQLRIARWFDGFGFWNFNCRQLITLYVFITAILSDNIVHEAWALFTDSSLTAWSCRYNPAEMAYDVAPINRFRISEVANRSARREREAFSIYCCCQFTMMRNANNKMSDRLIEKVNWCHAESVCCTHFRLSDKVVNGHSVEWK